LRSRVRAVWLRGQLLHLSAGMMAFCRWGILLFLAGMAIDWLIRIPMPGRAAILATLLVVSLYKAWRCGWREIRPFNATHTALRIEKHFGGLESLLVTAVQFGSSQPVSGTSASLCEMTCRQAVETVAPLRTQETVRYDGLRLPAAALLLLALSIGGFAVAKSDLLIAGAGRIFAPWLEINYPIRTHLTMETGDMVVKEGTPVQIKASVSGVIPSEAELALRTGTGSPRMHALEITDGECEYKIAAAFRGFKYYVIAGDSQSDWRSVDVISSPRIQKAEVKLEFPPYTKRPTETVEALTVAVPERTTVKWKLTLDRAVSKADFNPTGGDVQPLTISDDGLTVEMQQVVTQSRSYNFSWVERDHSFSFMSPSHYLQVSPDQPPRVELTSPKSNLYATLGRKIDLAVRARDDHGIGEWGVAYRFNKTEEKKVDFETPILGDGSETQIDWDYRTVLPKLAIGDSVSFVVELADRYPGPNGSHRARSQARRITFLSREDYLKHIAKQKQRLLSQLMAIYREERRVHEVVRSLDPADDVFIQTCQLEAVRQELIRGRLNVLKERIDGLVDDLAANNITDEAETAMLVRLSSDLQTVAKEHVGRAASGLRNLVTVSNKVASADAPDPAPAVHMVDSAARELGCLMLPMGFREATEVMARELHAIAQTQASLRLQTIMTEEAASDGTEALSKAQDELAGWITRLLGATPQDKESTIEDALIAFNLSRLVKQLRSAGVDAKMAEAVALIRKAESDDAARLQADVIKALLHAEFRLRVGSEYEALLKAGELFVSQADYQKKLREASAKLTPEQFNKRRSELGQAQAALRIKLHLLLMPAVPAPRPRLLDTDLPPQPPVDNLLAAAEGTMEKAAIHIAAGDRDKAAIQQQQASDAFEALSEIVRTRIEALVEHHRVAHLINMAGQRTTEIGLLEERQLSLLEKTQDAADDSADSAYLAVSEQKLVEDVKRLQMGIVKWNKRLATPNEDVVPLLNCLDKMVRFTTEAASSLKESQLSQAIVHQEAALEALAEATGLIEKQTANLSSFAAALGLTNAVLAPAPYVADIEAEQRDLIAATREAKPADLPSLAITQKNLVHAVNAVLDSLEVLSHKIESGTVMLFAKDDMEAAGIAIQDNDLVEAEDAQTFVAESLGDLLVEIQTVTPQYGYLLEVTEFFREIVSEGLIVRAAQSQIREKTLAAPDDASLRGLVDQQRALLLRAEAYGSLLHKATGLKSYSLSAEHMTAALGPLEAGDRSAALEQMKTAEEAIHADTESMLDLMVKLNLVLAPPPPGTPADAKPSPEVALLLDVLALSAQQKALYRKSQIGTDEQMAGFAKEQRELEKRCAAFVPASKSHVNIVSARRHTTEAAAKLEASSRAEAVSSQREAGEVLRYFIIEYVQKYVVIPDPPSGDGTPGPPVDAPDAPFVEHGGLFMPGAISGAKPKGGRLEWEVLGRRDRAALNENFARELPLEYRAILKDYYERLAQ
ncbi:MAG: hypothetical protein HQ567_10370, partial [Candidatus Nealsonbacteria bacterium]|nr:hypothetical protein [Candidatus Nealsonbacteria bacterium]